jgi:hypothetical protein
MLARASTLSQLADRGRSGGIKEYPTVRNGRLQQMRRAATQGTRFFACQAAPVSVRSLDDFRHTQAEGLGNQSD